MRLDIITAAEAGTLPGLFRQRCERTPGDEAYVAFDPVADAWKTFTWHEVSVLVARWQTALAREQLAPGERVAILLKNSVEWVCFDQAAQSLGLVVVPLYPTDSPGNVAYILGDCGACVLLVGEVRQWLDLAPHRAQFPQLRRVLCVNLPEEPVEAGEIALGFVDDWLPFEAPPQANRARDPYAIATIVFTSGTTGRPKGVMLTHRNILCNAEAVLAIVPAYREDLFLSFLPLSHAFERTVGYYLPVMAGSRVAFSRGIDRLADDLCVIRPTVLVSVPRIYERVYAHLQRQLEEKGTWAKTLFRHAVDIGWQRYEAAQRHRKAPGGLGRITWPMLKRLVAEKLVSRFGGRLRLAVSGGAPLSATLSQTFLGLGLPVLQGYGLTEASPVVTGNRLEDNVPDSVGVPLPGLELRLGNKDELLVRGPSVMLGYWNQPEETEQAIDKDGWLHTGDQASIDENGHVRIVGRLKEIIVMSTGEKVAPADLEMAITQTPLVEQAMVVGEGKPFLAALLVLNPEAWRELAAALSIDADHPQALAEQKLRAHVLDLCNQVLRSYPSHARLRNVWLAHDPWTIGNGLVTPTLKIRRAALEQRFAEQIRQLYAGHEAPG